VGNHTSGDVSNAAIGYNFRRLIQWLRLLMLRTLRSPSVSRLGRNQLEIGFFTRDQVFGQCPEAEAQCLRLLMPKTWW
jgi:hypothetical protein